MPGTSVRAKFLVHSVTNHNGGNVSIEARPVTSGGEENKSFSKYTPGGLLQLSIDKDTPAHQFFVPGKCYYIDVTEAPD